MKRFLNAVLHGLFEDRGQALVEYGLIVALIALAAIAAVTTMGGGVDSLYTTLETAAETMSSTLGGSP